MQDTPQRESTPFHPRSPYGVAKLYAYWITVNYRQAFGMNACNGILFNHESPRCGETFVIPKLLDVSRLSPLGWQARIPLAEGLASTCFDWLECAAAQP